MPSNRPMKQTPAVKMKQQPSRKKVTTKPAPEDSISETISFVIKGKLTPIKPAYIAKKLNVTKKIVKLDKTIKLAKTPTRKSPSRSDNQKTANLLVENVKMENKPSDKKSLSPKSNDKPLVRKKALPVKRKVVKRVQRSDRVEKMNKILHPEKEIGGDEKTESDPEKFEEIEKAPKADKKKPKIQSTISKQSRASLGVKKKQQLLKDKVVEKPKIIDRVKTNKKKTVSKDHEGIETRSSEESKTVDDQKTQPSKTAKKEYKEDSTSDDNNLEELRKTLKSQSKETQKKKGKTNKITTNKKVTINSKLQKTKNAINRIKKARLEEQKLRKLKLFGFWNGPKRKRVASLNAIAKVHCLYENEGKISMLDNPEMVPIKREVAEKNPKIEKKEEEVEAKSPPPQRNLRCMPGLRGAGKHWDMHNASSSSSEEPSSDEEPTPKKTVRVKKEQPKKNEETKIPKKRKRKQAEIVMDLKDMVVRKRMASLNATAILAASYSQEKRSPRSPKSDRTDDTDSSDDDLTTDEEQEGRRCYENDVKKEEKVIEVHTKPNKKVAVIVNQDTDVTITGVYVNSTTRSTHHEGYCSIAGMQYRISATSHTQTAATAVATETLLQSGSGTENNNAESLTPTGKSYKPLDALSNMRPPSDGAHHQGMAPPQHVMAMSPSGVRHSCTSAFTAPHPSAYQHVGPGHHVPPPPPPTMTGEPGYIHGYYQPAGPLITVPLGHGQPPLAKSAPLSETSPTTPSPLSSHPPHPPPSNNGDSSDSEVIITSVTAGKDVGPPPQMPPAGHSSYRYQYPPNVPPANYSYPYSSHYYHPSPAPPPSYPPHDVCYSPGPYVHHKFPPTSYRRYLGGPQYYPPNPPPSQEIYAMPTHAQPSQQIVTTTPVSGSGPSYQNPLGPTPSSTILEPYPPTLVETYPAHYYTGYPPGPPSTCYSHAPPPRAVPFINGAYQNCPCPMQSCPKNGLTGPLTGDSKRSGTLPKVNMPSLPPVALALPKEPTSDGPPSPARGSAGMPPPPSPAGATYQQQPTPPTKQESISPEHQIPVEKKRKARVGKAMVRSNMQNTMLLMCNPVNSVKREIESPKEKEVIIVPESKDVALNIDSKIAAKVENFSPKQVEPEVLDVPEPPQLEPVTKLEEDPQEPKDEVTVLEPVLSTVGENVKVKNMKRKLSLSVERKTETPTNPPKKRKTEVRVKGSYKNLIKKNTNSVKINNDTADTNPKKSKQSKSKTALTNENKKIKQDVTQEPKEIVKRSSSAKSIQKLAANMLDNLIAKNNVDRTIECVVSGAIRTGSVTKKTDKVREEKQQAVSATAKKSTKKTSKPKKSKCKSTTEVVPNKPQKSLGSLRWSNGWNWEGESFEAKVFLNSDETTVIRKCYPSMRHHSGDLIQVKDCVLLKAGARKNELPFVAKIAALWENPEDGEMMMSLLWYYRPEHTDQGRVPTDQPDEVFASRHKDSNSVACIDDKCYVLTFNEYCRYRRELRRIEEGIEDQISTCIPTSESYPRSHRQPPNDVKISPEMVFFCRRVYDFRQKRMIKNPS